MTAGFVIFSHRDPAPLLRQVGRRNRRYGDPPIACRRAQWLLDERAFPTPLHPKLQQHLTMRSSPDECYLRSVLYTDPIPKLVRDHRRYVQGGGGGAHPQSLTGANCDATRASGAHFARKFAHGAPVLDRIDALLFG